MKLRVLRPNFEKRGGIIPVVVQHWDNLHVLMVGYTNEPCFMESLETGFVVLWSTSRNERWKKGETSGDTLELMAVHIDCDGDALVYRAKPMGTGVCHTRAKSCFYRDAIGGKEFYPVPNAGEKEKLPIIEIDVIETLARPHLT